MAQYERTDKDWEKHFNLLGALYLAFSGMGIIAGIVTFTLITGAGMLSGDATAIGITSTVATVLAIIILVISTPTFIIGWGLLRRWNGIKFPAMIVGILNLPAVPFGTILGIYTLWLFMMDGANTYLEKSSR